MRRAGKVIVSFCILFSIMALNSCNAARPEQNLEPEVEALLSKYEQPQTCTGGCEWIKAKVIPINDVIGRIRMMDEHYPDQFFPERGAQVSGEVRYGGPLAFALTNPKLREQAYELSERIRLSGYMVAGQLYCSGNSVHNPGANQSFQIAFLVNEVNAGAEQ